MSKSLNERYVVILGSGPAGLTAALYTARANLKPLVFEGPQPGGQLTITTDVENFPGFEHGILGPELMDTMHRQAERFGAEFIMDEVIDLDIEHGFPFTVRTREFEVKTQSLIIATGASAKLLGIPSEKELMGYGVSACATCDGFFFRDKEIAVVGGGDTAMEEAIFLTKFASKVTIIHRREVFRASKVMLERARNNPKIQWLLNYTIEEILGTKEKGVHGVILKNTKDHSTIEYPIQGLFIGIGHQPNTSLFNGKLPMDENGYLKVQPFSTRTVIQGVYAAGDVADHVYRQAVTAAGTGCMAAIDCERDLAARGIPE
ncbi:MAG: thioredoxin-disulfide reductase [bacterium]|nr:thioredoxin-disulfide reductase [bacterium]